MTVCSVNKVSTRALGEWMSYTPEYSNYFSIGFDMSFNQGSSFLNIRAKLFNLDELRRIFEILSTNRVDSEQEVAYLSHLLLKANITSNNGRYEHVVNAVSLV